MVRLVSGIGLAAVFLALIWFASATVLLVVALAVATLALQEYRQLMRQLGADVPAIPALLTTWATLIVVPFPRVPLEIALTLGLVVMAITVMSRLGPAPLASGTAEPLAAGAAAALERDLRRAGHDVAAAVLAPVYLGLPLGALVAVHVIGGRGAVLLLMTTIVVSDSAQFYSGRLLGRHPLAPRISPKKTIEGAIGGFVLAPIFLVLATPYFVPPATNQLAIAGVGLALVAAGIAGDLFESTLKRGADVKDSSALIPGHGGVLDRIDALLFASPIYYIYVRWVYTP